MEEHKVDLHLTSKQKSKYMKGEPFQKTNAVQDPKKIIIIFLRFCRKKNIIIY